MSIYTTQNVSNGANALVKAMYIARGSLAEVLYARVAQTAAVLTVATVEQARDLAWDFAATYSVRAAKYAYVATPRDPRATPIHIEADGRPELPAL